MARTEHTDAASGGDLAQIDDWDSTWSDAGITSITFDPDIPIYREMHRIMRAKLPKGGGRCFIEIGAYPGYLMWYFHQFFDYRVAGLEFVPWCCQHAKQLLANEGVDAELIEADLFSYAPSSGSSLWDVVASNGFIEHFQDVVPAISRHVELTKPNGHIVIAVPNHASIYGWVMKKVRPDKWKLHNLMTLDDMLKALSKAGDVEIVFSGYTGRFGFWASCLYETAKKWGPVPYFFVRAPLWVLENMAQWCVPNSRWFSPSFMVIARRVS